MQMKDSISPWSCFKAYLRNTHPYHTFYPAPYSHAHLPANTSVNTAQSFKKRTNRKWQWTTKSWTSRPPKLSLSPPPNRTKTPTTRNYPTSLLKTSNRSNPQNISSHRTAALLRRKATSLNSWTSAIVSGMGTRWILDSSALCLMMGPRCTSRTAWRRQSLTPQKRRSPTSMSMRRSHRKVKSRRSYLSCKPTQNR